MNILLLGFGLLLLCSTMIDVLWTTISLTGHGPITGFLARGIWHVFKTIYRKTKNDRIITIAGPIILICVVSLWILLLWSAYFFIFHSSSSSIIVTKTENPADFWEKVYFTGFTIFTLGIGDVVPRGEFWRLVTVLASVNGLFLVTLSVTYMVPLLSAVAQKKQIAGIINSLGHDPQQILINAWTGKDFQGLGYQFIQMSSLIELHAQKHLAYPILHYFNTSDTHSNLAPSLARLHEALLLMKFSVKRAHRLAPVFTDSLLHSIHNFLNIMAGEFIYTLDENPSFPNTGGLKEAEIKIVDQGVFENLAVKYNSQRQALLSFVQDFGADWNANLPIKK